jgi:hypothetical protein
MESNERIFRHSFGKLALMCLGLLIFGFLIYLMWPEGYFLLLALIGIGLIVTLFYSTGSIKVSDQEVTSSRLLGSKSLRWSEIERISMRGQNLRLHNHDEDIVLSLDSQVEGYPEILDIVFSKRPDLFKKGEDTVLSSGWLANLYILGFGLFLIIAFSVFMFSLSEEFEKISSAILVAMGVWLLVSWFLSPKSIALEDRTLLVMHFFKEVSYSAEDIRFISLEKTRTKDGYVYFPQLNLKSGKKIKLPGFKQGTVITYQVLKKWHEKAISNRDNYFRNARV